MAVAVRSANLQCISYLVLALGVNARPVTSTAVALDVVKSDPLLTVRYDHGSDPPEGVAQATP